MSTEQDIPYGYCHCGCGEKTPISTKTKTYLGHKKGTPRKFLQGHKPLSFYTDRYEVDERTGCWNWTGTMRSNGYGAYRRGREQKAAHKVIYELRNGPVPAGYDLDHLCRNRACVNPAHLEPVSRSENLRRGSRGKMTVSAIFALRLADASTSLTRVELAEMVGISGRNVTRYLGSQGHGRNREKIRRERYIADEFVLATSCQKAPYPAF